jgi:hypothetical protein
LVGLDIDCRGRPLATRWCRLLGRPFATCVP